MYCFCLQEAVWRWGSMFIPNSIHTRWFVSLWKYTILVISDWNDIMKGDGVCYGILVLAVRYCIAHCTEIKFCFLFFNTTPVLYILPLLTTGGHRLASKLLLSCRLIKIITLYMCFDVSCLSEISFHYNYILYIWSFYVFHVTFCYGMSHCLCSELVKLIVQDKQ